MGHSAKLNHAHRTRFSVKITLNQPRVAHSDPIKVAGGAKCLASPQREGDREFFLERIRPSMSLHGTKRVILMVHSDCGATEASLAAFIQSHSQPRDPGLFRLRRNLGRRTNPRLQRPKPSHCLKRNSGRLRKPTILAGATLPKPAEKLWSTQVLGRARRQSGR